MCKISLHAFSKNPKFKPALPPFAGLNFGPISRGLNLIPPGIKKKVWHGGAEGRLQDCQVSRAKVVPQGGSTDHLLLTPMATNPASLKIQLGSTLGKSKCLVPWGGVGCAKNRKNAFFIGSSRRLGFFGSTQNIAQ